MLFHDTILGYCVLTQPKSSPMKDYINEAWRSILVHNGLADFEALWSLEASWFEAPNERRGGWSGVSRCELQRPEGGTAALFLKRQKNHRARSLLHPVSGIATFQREFERVMTCRAHDIATLEPVFFGVRGTGKDQRAILATVALDGFVSLDELVRGWQLQGVPPRAERLPYLHAVAHVLKKMHAARIRHSCFFPKHIFVRANADGTVEARVIDLEKSRSHQWKSRCAQRDLYSLNYYSPSSVWPRTDRLRFLRLYLDISRLDVAAKSLWRNVNKRCIDKARSRQPVP